MAASPLHTDLTVIRDLAGVVLRNWLHEIHLFLQEKLPFKIVNTDDDTIVVVQPDTIRLCRFPDETLQLVADIARDKEQPRAVAAELSKVIDANRMRRDVTLVLPAGEVLRPKVRMPAAKPEHLRGALRYEMDRLCPIDPDEVYFDFSSGRRDPEYNTVETSLRIVGKSALDDAIALCRAAQTQVAEIYFDDDPKPADARAYPIDRKALLRMLWHRYCLPLTAGLVCLLAMTTLFAAYARSNAKLDAVSGELVESSMQAAQIARVQKRIAETRTALFYPAQQKRSPLFVAVLSRLTELMPDGAWISELQVEGTKIHIQGSAPSASDLIGLIDRSGLFANARFDAPVLRDSSNNTERFNIAFEVRSAER